VGDLLINLLASVIAGAAVWLAQFTAGTSPPSWS
jgi:hypothetical protein